MPMRIGLISDTHIPGAAQALPLQITEAFRGVELILHAGDIYVPSVLDELEQIAPVLAVSGDDDYGATLRDERVKWKHTLQLDGRTLWLVHESPFYYLVTSQQANRSSGQNDPDAPDIVVFGHSHYPSVQDHNGILFINPGSPTFLKYQRGLGTVAVLTLNSGESQVDIIQL